MLRDRLYYLLNNNFQKDTTYIIAEYIINHLEKMGEISIYKVAEDCHTSVATISRFCRKIGFQDYMGFRDACVDEKEALEVMRSSHPQKHALMKNGMEGLPEELATINEQLLGSIKELSMEKVHRLLEDIYRYKNVFFVGLSNSFVMYGHLQMELLSLEKYCYVITELPGEEVQINKENSLAILFSMHGNMIKYQPEIVDFVKENFDKSWEVSQVNKCGKLDDTLYFGKCGKATADYMAWLYVAEILIYEYKILSKK